MSKLKAGAAVAALATVAVVVVTKRRD